MRLAQVEKLNSWIVEFLYNELTDKTVATIWNPKPKLYLLVAVGCQFSRPRCHQLDRNLKETEQVPLFAPCSKQTLFGTLALLFLRVWCYLSALQFSCVFSINWRLILQKKWSNDTCQLLTTFWKAWTYNNRKRREDVYEINRKLDKLPSTAINLLPVSLFTLTKHKLFRLNDFTNPIKLMKLLNFEGRISCTYGIWN